jgi:hypothetical protein
MDALERGSVGEHDTGPEDAHVSFLSKCPSLYAVFS